MKMLLALMISFSAYAITPPYERLPVPVGLERYTSFVEEFHSGLAIMIEHPSYGGSLQYQYDVPGDANPGQGLWALSTGTTTVDARTMVYIGQYNYFRPGYPQRVSVRLCLPVESNSTLGYKVSVGYSNFGFVGGSVPRGPLLSYTHTENDGKWQAVLRKWTGSGDVDVARIDTGVAWSTDCRTVTVMAYPQEKIEWYMDGVMVAQTSSNMPNSGELMYPFAMLTGVNGTGARLMAVDVVDVEWFKEISP